MMRLVTAMMLLPPRSFRRLMLSRSLAFFICFSLAYSMCALGVSFGLRSLAETLAQLHFGRAPQFSQRPTKPYLGAHPGKDEGRGLWSRARLEEVKVDPGYLLSASSAYYPPSHSLAVSPSPGSSYAWEGTSPAGKSGSVNTANGDRLTTLHLFDFKVRGGQTLSFTLYHNSQTNYSDELGYGWTWSYDIYINNLGSAPTLHWGDGLSVPFGAGPSYSPPAGISDSLVKNADATWTLTRKDGTKYSFNTSGFCTGITDRNGNTISLSLNAGNYVTQVTAPDGRYVSISLDASNHFLSVTDPAGNSWSFTRNASNDLTTVTWPLLSGTSYSDQFGYDTSHHITSHTDRRGKLWQFAYNTDGSLATAEDPLGHTSSYTYTSSATTMTDPLLHSSVDNYSGGILASSVDGSGFSESYTSRDTNHNVTTLVDKRGKTWHYTYDSKGNVLTEQDPLLHTRTLTYNGFGEVLTDTDALSHQTSYSYDTSGNLLTATDPLSRTAQTNTYGSYGLLSTSENYLGKLTSFSYDANGNLSSVTDPLLHVTSCSFDSLSRLTSTTDALSHTESVSYDVWSRPTVYTHPGGSTLQKAYDPEGNLTGVTDELGHTSSYAYDDAGRLSSITSARGDTESYGYDSANRRTSVTNGRSKVSTYTFTARGDTASLTMPDGALENWTYDGNGDLTAYENPLSQTISYSFDDAGRQTGITYPTGPNVSFAYDNADRRTSMVDATGTTSWTLDAASQLTGLSTPQGNITYTYDMPGRRATMVETGVGTTSYGYDDDSRLTSLTNPQSETTSWVYNDVNEPTRQTFASGAYTQTGYDSRNRVSSVVHYTSSGSVISSESYALDDASRLASKTVDSVATAYGYDDSNQLTSESRSGYSASYTYNANGNRASKTLNGSTDTYAVDDGDKLTSITNSGATVKSYTYDAAGRTKTVATSSGTTTLSYDYEDRLTGITYPGSTTNSFTYSGLDTRVGKMDSSGTATYKRDGADVTDPVLSDGVAAYTPGISEHRSGGTSFDHTDYLGTISRQTNSSQITSATRQYDAFGLLVATTGTPQGPFGFAGAFGYQEDQDSGLKLLGHRYYDASTGRFVTRDAAKDGRNWYGYAGNQPTSRVDPSGNQVDEEGSEIPPELPEPGEDPAAVGDPTVGGLLDLGRDIYKWVKSRWWPETDPTIELGPPTIHPDTSNTPGRDKVSWPVGGGYRVVKEGHPYDDNGTPKPPPDPDTTDPRDLRHYYPHYHFEGPGIKHLPGAFPGDEFPSFLIPLRGGGGDSW